MSLAVPRVAIVGAGIGGLAAAHHLTRRAAERGTPLEVVVLEASDQAGGWLATERCEGALLERGADTLVTHKPAGLRLCERLGLGGRLVFKPAGRIDILDRGRLLPLPAGFSLTGPFRARPLLASPLLSWHGKLRALAEPWVARAAGDPSGDESVAAYVRRRCGEEVHRRITEPVVGGLFMADTEEMSFAASFPQRRPPGAPAPAPSDGPSPPAPAATLDGGLGQIVAALVDRLPLGALRLGARVGGIAREDQGYLIRMSEEPPLAADAVLVALPAPAAAPLLGELDPALAAELVQISYASAVTVHLAWSFQAVGQPPRCHGFFVPRTAGSPVVAASFVSVKYPERVPADQLVVRVFLGGALHPEAIDLPDAELLAMAAGLLAPLVGLRGGESPLWTRVWRHRSAMPQRRVGHPALVGRLLERLRTHPGLDVAGGPLGAYGLPDSIAAGEAAAERLLGRLWS